MKSENLKEKSGFFINPLKKVLSDSFVNLFILWVFGAVWIFLSLIMPEQVGKITNLFSSGKEVTWDLLRHRIFLMITAQISLSVIVYMRGRMLDFLQERTFRSLAMDMFRRILRFKGSFFQENEIEKINVRIFEDAKVFSMFYTSFLGDILIEIVCVIIFSYIMISTHWLLGITIIAISFLLGYVILFDGKIQKTTKKIQQNWEKARTDSTEILSGVSEIRSHSIFEYGELKLKKTLDNFYNVKIDCSKLTSLFTAMGPMVRNVQMAGLFAMGASLCIGGTVLSGLTGKMVWGDVIQFGIMTQIFQVRFSRIADFFIQWRLANQSIIRVKEYIGKPCSFINSSENPAELAGKKDISFEKVSVSHGHSLKILDKINLTIKNGSHVAFVGPSGSGKTTIVSLVSRDIDSSSGQVKIGDEPLQNYDILSLGKQTGMVSQKPFILNTTIRNNLLLGLRHSKGLLKDDEGSIDIERLKVKTIDELNAKIIETLRLIGLEDDIFGKFVASPLPALPASGIFKDRIDDIRKDVTGKITDKNLIIKFNINDFINGTVFENILGPGFLVEHNFETHILFLYELLKENDLLEEFIMAGYKIFIRDCISTKSLTGELSRNIFPYQKYIDDEELEQLRGEYDFSEKQKFILLRIVLSSDIKKLFLIDDVFKEKIIKLRAFLKDKYMEKSSWKDLEEGKYIDRLTVRGNFISGRPNKELFNAVKTIDMIIKEILKEKNLLHEALLLGLEFQCGEGGKFLSGGQRQKISIGRTILKEPEILILDEATASLDEISQSQIVNLVKDRFKDKTVLSVSHRLSTIKDSDCIFVLDRGHIVEEGSYDELVSKGGLFYELVIKEEGKELPPMAKLVMEKLDEITFTEDSKVSYLLSLCPIFSHMNNLHISYVQKVADIDPFGKGEVIYRPGEQANEVYIILRGEVELFSENETRDAIKLLNPVEIFGEKEVMGGENRQTGARALSDVILCVIKKKDFMELISADNYLALSLLKNICSEAFRAGKSEK